MAFLTFDETGVDEFTFPIYNPTEDGNKVVPYTKEVKMRYPKPGYKNPEVGVWVFDLGKYLESSDRVIEDELFELDWEGRHLVDNSIISGVTWVGDEALIVKEVNRNADNGSVVLFDLSLGGLTATTRSKGAVVRKLGKEGEQGDSGWIDQVRCS